MAQKRGPLEDHAVDRWTDGMSDRVLVEVIDWLVRDIVAQSISAAQFAFADLRTVNPKPNGLAERIQVAVELYPCDLLVVHRDAEGEPAKHRRQEIEAAIAASRLSNSLCHVAVVPVRMTEAWLLIDEKAIRRAAGNPSGTVPLHLPQVNSLERLADPKKELLGLLRIASELTGRKLKKFNPIERYQNVAQNISTYAPLRQLGAFTRFETDLRQAIANRGGL